jgi:hypothetical protein
MSGDEFGSLLVIGSILCSAVFLVLWIGSLIWVYQDAEKRGKSGCIWLLLLWFTWPIGLFAYLVLRDKEVKL